ncbi:MAG: hypothetical protein ACI8S6_002319 [Myxococcota bacterium]|jgi:hypothetical protein
MTLAVLFLSSALAGPGPIDAALVTDFPVLVGASVAWEPTSRLRAELTGGFLPGPYLDTINWGLTTFDVYSDTTAELIDAVLQDALIVHAQVGYRLIEDRGLSFSLGYQHIGLAGDTTDISLLIDADVSEEVYEKAKEEVGELDVSVSPHMITGEVGYQWLLRERLVLRSSLAFAYTVQASATVSTTEDARGPAGQQALDALTDASEDYLVDVFEQWVHLPMLGVSVGYRFP